ncbi:hypothetical protein Q8A67_011392 [Cirrhinus molitorella]|uniref:Glycine N-acyltransferase-like protein n=1 Tax=Cirrhinus molitorella TaxID=172907 RepID=A0AA88TY07_9TELE|nr:hypothetical protein Q8A67_011392 [Cirrhinus molitorella]
MKILNSDELKIAETTLYAHLPKSIKAYGFVFAMNRGKPHTLEVLVDTWPAFTTIIVRPDPNNNRTMDFRKKVTLYSTDEEVLKRMLTVENAIDWSTYFLIGGCDLCHSPMLKEIAASRGISMKGYSLVHLMTLTEPSHLPELITRDLESRVSVLNESHADVVNKTWKFGGDDKGYRNILNLIRHFPTCCITDENNQPVSWVLLYDYCAMGMLYTQPEHRGKGYAKALITTMAKRLHYELKVAETALYAHLPKSIKGYAYPRLRTTALEVLVDTWPAFTTIIFRPDPNNNRAKDYLRKVTIYSTDEEVLRRMLTVENAIDWSTYFLIGGCDVRHLPLLKEIAASRGVSMKEFSLVHLMTLTDPSHLPELVTSDLESRRSVLTETHVDVINKTWKFGGDEKSYRNILHLIRHFPSCCITDENNQPVSWVLSYDYYAMGMLYTQPEHRGKGYAKALITTMAKRLHSQGYPVYCFIEESNELSYKLFKSLGFTDDPSYRATWYELNY